MEMDTLEVAMPARQNRLMRCGFDFGVVNRVLPS